MDKVFDGRTNTHKTLKQKNSVQSKVYVLCKLIYKFFVTPTFRNTGTEKK